MASRGLKDEMLGTEGEVAAPKAPIPQSNSIQIAIGDDIELSLTEAILSDYDSAKEHRNKQDFGTDSKGVTLTFDNWLEKLKRIYSGHREAKTVPWKFCYSKDTEILTNLGWKLVKDVTSSDLVYSMNPLNRKAKWMPVINTVSNYYDEMIHFKGKSADLMVSKDHQMFLERKSGFTSFKPAIKVHESFS